MRKYLSLIMCLFALFPSVAYSISGRVLGDINSDDRINLEEAVYALQVSAGIKPQPGTEYIAMYTATGTYSFDNTTLTLNFTNSSFPENNGPGVGTEQFSVSSVTETTMIWENGDNNQMIWTRKNGSGDDITGFWEYNNIESEFIYRISFESDGLTSLAGYLTDYEEYFTVRHRNISIDGNFDDWNSEDRIYTDTDGPECNNSPGQDIKEVYIAQDEQFIYLRYVLNGEPDETFGYKFGNDLHIYVGQENGISKIFYATPVGCSSDLPGSFVSVRDNQFECKFSICDVNWEDMELNVWCDQGRETVCRDHVSLPKIIFDLSGCEK